MIWIWIGLIITLMLIELLTKNLITIWYVLSAIIALIVSLFMDSYFIEFSIFVIIGSILLFTLRDKYIIKLKEYKKNKKVK